VPAEEKKKKRTLFLMPLQIKEILGKERLGRLEKMM
jgi:hypothetical protein